MTPGVGRGTAPGAPGSRRIDRLRVEVGGDVDVHELAAAVRRRVAGGTWPGGPERQVADAVVAAADAIASTVDERAGRMEGATRWR